LADASVHRFLFYAYHTAFDDFLYVEKHVDPGFVGHELAGRLLALLLAEIAERGEASFSPAEAAQEWSRRALEARTELGEPAARLASAFESAAPDRATMLGRFEPGLPGRPWFRNRLWAPGLEDGYGSETFPLLRAAAMEGESALATEVAAWIEALGSGESGGPATAPTGN
jgi:hypothetical protein